MGRKALLVSFKGALKKGAPKLEPGARQGQAMGAQGGMNDLPVFISNHELFHAVFPPLLVRREREWVAELPSG